MRTLLSKITDMQSDLSQEINSLRTRLRECENKIENHEKKIDRIDEKTNEISKLSIKEEEKIPYAFCAPTRNRYFSGREKEIEELHRILKADATMNEKKVHVAAVCGLGGVGKTSLVAEYAHRKKDFYKGGVYWFSAENDTFLHKTVNDIAWEIGASLNSFDLTLSNTVKKISSLNDPSLIVLDCLDQLDLSTNVMKFLSIFSQKNIFGRFVILTRRKPNLLVNEVSILEDRSCLRLKCFQSAEAKQFLLSRTGLTDDRNAKLICDELGKLPLALEQAGTYIKMLSCSLSSYLEQYRTERLQLLCHQQSRPISPGNESPERLAVHTTWRMNMEYMKKSPNGQAAVRFMNACSFFNGNEIEDKLINVGRPEVEDEEYRKCVLSPLGRSQILKLLTDFSLFTYVKAHSSSVRTHRLVQELVREGFNATSKAESCTDAVRMLSYVFSECPSPSDLVSGHEINDDEQSISITNLPNSPSHFNMWAKLCMHGHYLRTEMGDLLISLDSLRFLETSQIVYECAVHLSANHKQEEAKRALNFAYRMLDWLSLSKCEAVKKTFSNNSVFPLSLPLPKSVQMVINRCCMPPFSSLQSLTGVPDPGSSRFALKEQIEKLRLDGNTNFKQGRHLEALDSYSSAIELAKDCDNAFFDPLLLTNRATVYIKLEKYEDALKDANDYIVLRPNCWRGYARKALALNGLNDQVSAEVAAALALFYQPDIFSNFPPFNESFLDVKERVFICNSVNQFREAIISVGAKKGELKILVLGSEEYILNFDAVEEPWNNWNNCVVVGTKKDHSVSLKSDKSIQLRMMCTLINLSFCFKKGNLFCAYDSDVRMLSCNFSSTDVLLASVTSEGEFYAKQCTFTNISGFGLSCRSDTNNAIVDDCSFINNGEVGLYVGPKATLKVKNSRMYSNGLSGLMILESKCVVVNCVIEHNCDGINILYSKDIELIRNSVFCNTGNGVFIVNSEVDISENSVFDNGLWGVWSQSDSRNNISSNRIFRNNAGGVRVGYQTESNSLSAIEMNKIYDNNGPGFVKNMNGLEVFELSMKLRVIEDFSKWITRSPMTSTITFTFATFRHNEERNNKESRELNLSVPYCSNCRKKCEPKMCEECFTAAYCKVSCRKEHMSKHELICKILREKSSYLISSMKNPEHCDGVEEEVERRKEKSKNRLPLNRRFVVKVRSVTTLDNSYRLMVYDNKLRLHKTFDSKFIKKLVKEFGVLCERKCFEKKLFFYCIFEGKGQYRLITNEFPEFQSW